MHTFTDLTGRVWEIKISVAAIERVAALTGIDMLDVAGGQVMATLRHMLRLTDLAWALIKPDAEPSVTAEEFRTRMAGDSLQQAADAIRDELVDFFPSPGDRANVRALLTKSEELLSAARELIGERIAAFDPRKVLDRAQSDGGSGNSPASADATPAT